MIILKKKKKIGRLKLKDIRRKILITIKYLQRTATACDSKRTVSFRFRCSNISE